MGSADAYELAWQTVLAPLKLFFIILVSLLAIVIIYSISLHQDQIDMERIELFEIRDVLVDCLVENSVIQVDKIDRNYLESCMNARKYGAKIEFGDKSVIVNDLVYTTYRGFCGRMVRCDNVNYRDLNGDMLNFNLVFREDERNE